MPSLTGTGVAARQRKAELERLNDQLRKINMSLRQQARAGTVYAPGLNYAPIPMPASPFKASAAAVLEEQSIKTINGVQVLARLLCRAGCPPCRLCQVLCRTASNNRKAAACHRVVLLTL